MHHRWEPGWSSATLVPGGAAEAGNEEDYDYEENRHYFKMAIMAINQSLKVINYLDGLARVAEQTLAL